MNEDLQKQLAELLAKLTVVAEDSATWAGQQIPPLVQEKILIGRISATLYFVLCVVGVYVAYRWVNRFVALATSENDGFGYGLGAVFVSGVGAAAAVCAAVNLNDAILVWFAPRLYIVEWLREMITK